MKKIFLITLFLSCFIFNKSIAATGEAQEYTITMTPKSKILLQKENTSPKETHV